VSQRRIFRLSISLALALAVLSPQAALGGRALYESASVAGEAVTNAPVADDATSADDAEASKGAGEADEAGQPERKGNGFARALTAPLRALARLFGGGRKSKSEQAKKQSTPPARVESAAASTQAVMPPDAATQTATPPTDSTNAQPSGQTQQQSEQIQPAATVNPIAEATVKPIEAPLAPAPARANDEAAGVVKTESVFVARPAAPVAQGAGARIVRPAAGELAEEARPKMWVPLIVGVPADSVSQGRALLQQGYIQEAIAELQTAATVGAQLAEANNLLGLAYDRLGWHRQAAEAYGRALTVAPKDYVILANLGYSLYLADDYTGALRRLKQAARLAPSEPVIFNNLGVVHARLGHYDDAYKNFARSSNEYDAHLKLAAILEDQKRDKEAVKHYEAALRLQPGTSAVLERLVALYERTGQRDKADTARRALGQPKNPQKTTTGGGG
jgi:Flp pilus assembly protein TadD